MTPHEREALDGFVAAVRAHYGERLVEIAVFGSRARRDNRPDSDVDVAIVLRDGAWQVWREQRHLVDIGTDIFIDTGLDIEPWVFSEADWAEAASGSAGPLLRSARADAKAVRDAA